MIRSILASALLFASASLASAEYVIIIANVGTGNELNAQAGPGVGGPGGARGAPAGGGLGNRGIAPGGPGAGGGFGNQGGLRPGMMGGPNGMAGGMRGMRGMGGPGGMAQATDIDDIPDFIIAVVEVNPILPRLDIHKKLTDERVPDVMRSVRVKHHWGASTLLAKTDFAETIVLTRDSDRKPVPSVRDQFKKKFEETFKSKPPVSEILELADWTLTHGLVDEFPQVMDKLVEIDKSNPAAVAYLKVKADIDRPVKTDESSAWRGKLLKDYKVTDGPHYTIVHRHSSSTPTIAPHMKLLENSMRGFYYWFALKGVAQPVPDHRQVVVVTDQPKDFQHLQEILTSGPVVVDGFFAPRENMAVMTTQRQDDTYSSLKNFWKRWEDRNFHAAKLLSTDPALYKESHPPNSATKEQIHVAQMVALMLKALEQEGQRATISHDASRQLLFASGLLPRNVAAPEWLLFGMGSFFETPLWSPWSSFAAPNAYYLPRWKELKGKGLETKPGDTLRKVVSDAYFRALPPEGKADSVERHAYDAALRKARTTSWSLTYFLAKQKFDGLQRYFKEVSKMPRDLELDDEVLLGCFTRAFGLDDAGLIALEREWFSYLGNVKFASESTMRKIQTIFKDKLAQMQQAQNDGNGGQPQIDPRTGQPIQPGGNPQRPGGFGPGGNPQRPGGFGPGGNPQQPGNPGFRPQGGGVPQQGRNPRRPR